MAKLLWGKVYYKTVFAGILQEETGGRTSFTYDAAYLDAEYPAIAYTLPKQSDPFMSDDGLLPFFDNLVAEGWLENAQTRLLGERITSRLALLLAFGFDCAGAVSVIDPEAVALTDRMLDISDPKEAAIFTNRASLSGVQPKLMLVKEKDIFMPTKGNVLSTHIAKFPSRGHDDLVINEYLSMQAFKALLPRDEVVDLWISEIEGFNEPALIIKRFDRENNKRVHFEEFNQLMGLSTIKKYNGAYKDMPSLMKKLQGNQSTEIYRLYGRILAGILLGNTDMHLKNFSLFHTETGFSLTPSYDQVAAMLYDYKTMALKINNISDVFIGNLKAKDIVMLGKEFDLSNAAIDMQVKQLGKNLNPAKDAIAQAKYGSGEFKSKLIKMMEKRWNGTFALIGKALSKRQ